MSLNERVRHCVSSSVMSMQLAVQNAVVTGIVAPPASFSADSDAGTDAIVAAINELIRVIEEQDDPSIVVDGQKLYSVIRNRGRREQMRTGRNPWLE